MEHNSEIIIYTGLDGTTKIQVQLEDETVWLTQDQMAMLFGKAKSTINKHIKNIYAEGKLEESQTLKKFGITIILMLSSIKCTMPFSDFDREMKKLLEDKKK